MEFKVVISAKDGKSIRKDIKDADAQVFSGKVIGAKIAGDQCGFPGYELQITGGSDKAGFPMRRDVPGTGRKRILTTRGVGVKKKRKGQRQRKMVAGNTIHEGISQINLKILKEGSPSIFAEAPSEPAEEKPAEKPAKEEAKEKPKKKPAKEEAKAEEKPAEEAPEKEEPEKPAEEPKEKAKEEKTEAAKGEDIPIEEEKSAEKPEEKPSE